MEERPIVSGMRRRSLQILAGLVALAAIAAVAIVVLGSTSPKSEKVTPNKPIAASVSRLISYQKEVGHPVYWLGPFKGFTYELTQTSNGDSYIRYLKPGVKLGDPHPKWTIVGTYPAVKPYNTVRVDIVKYKLHYVPVSYHGIAVWSNAHPDNVYLAYPGLEDLIEIYDPGPAQAQKLALSSLLEPVR